MGREAALAQLGVWEVIPVLLGVGGISSLGLEAPVAGGSQDDTCLGKKSSICLYLDKEQSRVTLHTLFHKAPLHPSRLLLIISVPSSLCPQPSVVYTTIVPTSAGPIWSYPLPSCPLRSVSHTEAQGIFP